MATKLTQCRAVWARVLRSVLFRACVLRSPFGTWYKKCQHRYWSFPGVSLGQHRLRVSLQHIEIRVPGVRADSYSRGIKTLVTITVFHK